MIGAIIGDICGSVYEFNSCKDYDKIELFKKGCRFTDDTAMTVAVAAAMLDAAELCGAVDAGRDKVSAKEDVSGVGDLGDFGVFLASFEDLCVKRMREFGAMYPDAGYGGRFYQWLRVKDPKPYNSYGNGSAMRVSPVGWLFDTLDETLAAAESSARVTHNHPEGIKGAKAVAGSIFLARTGAAKDDIRAFVEGLGYDLDFTIDGIRPHYMHDESCQNSVPQGIKCFLESTDFEQCIRLTLSLGGDCDTTAAMSGAIAEAFYGDIPRWMMEQTIDLLPGPIISQYSRFVQRCQPDPKPYVFLP